MSGSHSLHEKGWLGREIAPAPSPLDTARALARSKLVSRPAVAWSLALLFVFKGLVCLAVVAFPISPTEPARLIAVVGIVAVLGGGAVWKLGARMPIWGFELLAALGALVTSGMVARASTHGGMMITAFAYPWIAIYAAHFFPRRVVFALGSLISVGFGVGLIVGGLPHAAIYWVIVTATTWSICIVLGELSESLRRQADTDPLTGLLNRNGFLTAANREHAIAQRTGNSLTVAVLDLDGFKQINDVYGHGVGDRLLVDLGRSWKERLRAGDVLARHGGDEFVLLLPATSVQGAAGALARLRDERLPVRWSVGIGAWLPEESFDECLARADADLYSVKHAIRVRAERGPGGSPSGELEAGVELLGTA